MNWAVSVPMSLAALVSSGTAMATATPEFLSRAMKMPPSGPTTVRRAWGMTTRRRTWGKVRPRARAASTWPLETELMPDRTVSPTNVPVYAESTMTAETKYDQV